jgi:hypothetical protein
MDNCVFKFDNNDLILYVSLTIQRKFEAFEDEALVDAEIEADKKHNSE